MRMIPYASLAVLLVLPLRAYAQDTGVTSEPDVALRAEQNTNALVVATVKRDEPFTYECESKAEWCKRYASLRGIWLVGARGDPFPFYGEGSAREG